MTEKSLRVSRILFHIVWVGGSIAFTHWLLHTPWSFLNEMMIQTGVASACFLIASKLK
jgi:hypothetical protein